MRAKINCVDPRAARGQFRNHFLVDLVHQRFRKNISRDSRLIGDHDDGNLRLIQLADGLGSEWKNLQAVDVIDVTHFLANGAVAIQKHGAAAGLCVSDILGAPDDGIFRASS